ncbi:lanC-like protein 3 homolog [Photinus pyralis]|nr:lanC-like protein 3 homolog [Photinus pyralis]
MAPTRFFPNISKDYASETIVEIPEDHIKTEINLMIENIMANLKAVPMYGEDGFYLGTAGVSYMFYHLSKLPSFQNQSSTFIENAVEYLQPSLATAQKYAARVKDVPSFVLGNCGIYALASVIYSKTGQTAECEYFQKLFYDTANTCKEMQFLTCGADELFVGRAGYICGALWLARELKIQPKLQDLYDICSVIVASGRRYASQHQSQSPLMYAYYDVEYLGAAHGLSSILQILLSVPGFLDANPSDAKDIKASVDYLLQLQDDEGNFPSATDEISRPAELVHWCHGAPGIVYLMAKAYLVWNEENYLKSCIKMADLVWNKGLLHKGPGLCHGIAGNAYVFLLLYRLTNDQKYLHRALVFMRFMETDQFKRHSRVPDNPFSLYEGIAGTVCFLADLTVPSKAAFPFFDVFNNE